MHPKVNEYLNVLNDNASNFYLRHYNNLTPPVFIVEQGRKYSKVVLTDTHTAHRSVHAFVDKDGNVYKAAGWAQPAKGVRYNLNTDMDVLRQKAEPHGGYLYR